ncbi:hypothetical protein ES703_100771 [subsurface metagenome]
MRRNKNPYPQFLIDEASGLEVPDIRHKTWVEGYRAGRQGRQVMKSIIKAPNDMVLVFDDKGEQIPEYQGQHEKVKLRILKDAPPSAKFSHILNHEASLKTVPREKW